MNSPAVSCKLEGAVLFDKKEGRVYTFQGVPLCCGNKGIFPRWAGEKSICKGPEKCALLEEGGLFYPPDKSVWFPLLESVYWEGLKGKFLRVDSSVSGVVRAHILEMQRKWGI